MIGICSLYANPLHEGHLEYLTQAHYYLFNNQPLNSYKITDILWVIVNNDKQVKIKGSILYMGEKIRLKIIKDLIYVNRAVLSVDEDESVSKTIEYLVKQDGTHTCFKERNFVFFNSGDRTKENTKKNPTEAQIKEAKICEKYGIKQGFLDLPKINNSSEILDRVGREWHQRFMTGQE